MNPRAVRTGLAILSLLAAAVPAAASDAVDPRQWVSRNLAVWPADDAPTLAEDFRHLGLTVRVTGPARLAEVLRALLPDAGGRVLVLAGAAELDDGRDFPPLPLLIVDPAGTPVTTDAPIVLMPRAPRGDATEAVLALALYVLDDAPPGTSARLAETAGDSAALVARLTTLDAAAVDPLAIVRLPFDVADAPAVYRLALGADAEGSDVTVTISTR